MLHLLVTSYSAHYLHVSCFLTAGYLQTPPLNLTINRVDGPSNVSMSMACFSLLLSANGDTLQCPPLGNVSELHQPALCVLGRSAAAVVVTRLSSGGRPQHRQHHHLSVRPPHQLRLTHGENLVCLNEHFLPQVVHPDSHVTQQPVAQNLNNSNDDDDSNDNNDDGDDNTKHTCNTCLAMKLSSIDLSLYAAAL